VIPYERMLTNIERRVAEAKPALLFLDVRFQDGESSVPLLPRLCTQHPETLVIVQTGYPERGSVGRALEAGARGYLVKAEGDGLPTYLIAAKLVLAGGIFLSPFATAELNRGASISWRLPPEVEADIQCVMSMCAFSRPLAEVAVLRHHGLSAKAIAGKLKISLHTVRSRFRHIYEKHQIHGIAEVMLLVERTLSQAAAGRRRIEQ